MSAALEMVAKSNDPVFQPVDEVVQSYLKEEARDSKAFAGAVLLVARDDEVIRNTAYGFAQLFDESLQRLSDPHPMRTDRVFDMASVTKAVATSLALALWWTRVSTTVAGNSHSYA